MKNAQFTQGSTWKILAKEIPLQVKNPITQAWVTIGGMSSYDLRFAKSNADITTFEQDFEDHIVSTRSFSVTANAFVAFTDKVLTARDPGQLIIEDGNYTSGRDSILDFRMIMADATTLEFKGSVTIGSMGGDVNAGTAWNFDIDGAKTPVTSALDLEGTLGVVTDNGGQQASVATITLSADVINAVVSLVLTAETDITAIIGGSVSVVDGDVDVVVPDTAASAGTFDVILVDTDNKLILDRAAVTLA